MRREEAGWRADEQLSFGANPERTRTGACGSERPNNCANGGFGGGGASGGCSGCGGGYSGGASGGATAGGGSSFLDATVANHTTAATNVGDESVTFCETATAFSIATATSIRTAAGSLTGGGANCTLSSIAARTIASIAGTDPTGATLPHGLLDLRFDSCTPGSTVTVTVHDPMALPAGTQYWRYGPAPDNATPHWYTLRATIAGNSATFSMTDGAISDDLIASGTIDDPGDPGASTTAVPSMPNVALILMADLLAITALRDLRRPRKAAAPR